MERDRKGRIGWRGVDMGGEGCRGLAGGNLSYVYLAIYNGQQQSHILSASYTNSYTTIRNRDHHNELRLITHVPVWEMFSLLSMTPGRRVLQLLVFPPKDMFSISFLYMPGTGLVGNRGCR